MDDDGYGGRPLILPPLGEWSAYAICDDPALFFPERHEGWKIPLALAICERCPVRRPCLDYAMGFGPNLAGIWGGTTQNWRRRAANRAAWRAGRYPDGRPADVGGRSVA